MNSLPFLAFFATVFVLYYLLSAKSRLQNILLLAASYLFYGLADWRMLPVLLLLTMISFFMGIIVEKKRNTGDEKCAQWLHVITVLLELLPLLYFKYFGFFVESFQRLLTMMGLNVHPSTLKILMPLGISFYTFRLLSYSIDINRGRISPTWDFIAFSTYVSFFPSIMSGPIDRPAPFLAQLDAPRRLNYENVSIGFKRVIFGLFTKVCLADVLAMYVGAVFNNYPEHSAISIICAVLLYPIQMYADFSGYSNMAIGLGQMLGIRMMENFKRPFLAQNVAEYWRRWHISLTSWLTDYVFMPANVKMRDWGKMGTILAIILNFILVGFWHGANWTFGFFGLFHALLFIPLILTGKMNKKIKTFNPLKCILVYILVSVGLLFFNSPTLGDGFSLIRGMFVNKGPLFVNLPVFGYSLVAFCIMAAKDFTDEFHWKVSLLNSSHKWVQYVTIVALISYMVLFGVFDNESFIYFQF